MRAASPLGSAFGQALRTKILQTFADGVWKDIYRTLSSLLAGRADGMVKLRLVKRT
jgi:hypothetical protein